MLCALMLLTACSANPWTNTERTLFTLNAGCHLYDARQSEAALDEPHRFEEVNPLLGKNPSERTLYGMKAGYLGLQYLALEYVMPDEYRAPYLLFGTALCLGVLVHNYSEGARP